MAKVILSHEPIESGMAKLKLTDENFGSVPKYYIECTEDRAVTPFVQRKMYNETPCQKVYRMHTGHSPFFCQPMELVRLITDIIGELQPQGARLQA